MCRRPRHFPTMFPQFKNHKQAKVVPAPSPPPATGPSDPSLISKPKDFCPTDTRGMGRAVDGCEWGFYSLLLKEGPPAPAWVPIRPPRPRPQHQPHGPSDTPRGPQDPQDTRGPQGTQGTLAGFFLRSITPSGGWGRMGGCPSVVTPPRPPWVWLWADFLFGEIFFWAPI